MTDYRLTANVGRTRGLQCRANWNNKQVGLSAAEWLSTPLLSLPTDSIRSCDDSLEVRREIIRTVIWQVCTMTHTC